MSSMHVERLAAQIAALRRDVDNISLTPQLGNSSLDNDSITLYDEDGNEVGNIGAQDDGTFGVVVVDGPPPPVPAGVSAVGGQGSVTVTWDGSFVGGVSRPGDFALVEIWAARTDFGSVADAQLLGHYANPAGGELTCRLWGAGEWHVALVARSHPGVRSGVSARVVVSVESIIDQSVIDQLEDATTGLDDRLTDAEGDLSDARDRLDAAEDDIVDAFGEIGDAKSDASAAAQAAQDAQSRADAASAEAQAAIDRATNLVVNGGFEHGTRGWETGLPAGGVVAVSNARSGGHVLRLETQGAHQYPRASVFMPSSPGRVYYMEFWARRQAGNTGGSVGLVPQRRTEAGGTGQPVVGNVPVADLSSTQWRRVSTWYEMPSDTVGVRFAPWVEADSARIDIDDMLVVDVTDAAGALAEAQAAAAAAAVAHQEAGDARDVADAAMVAAGTKTTTTYSTNPPAGVGQREGDTHRQRDTANNIVGEWRWTGTAWVKQEIKSEMISNLDVGKLTAGAADIHTLVAQKIAGASAQFIELDVAQLNVTEQSVVHEQVAQAIWTAKLAARKVLSNEVLIGGASNIVPDPHFLDEDLTEDRLERSGMDAWTRQTSSSIGHFLGGSLNSFRRFNLAHSQDSLYDVAPGEEWLFRAKAYANGSQGARILVEWVDESGTRTVSVVTGWKPWTSGGWEIDLEGSWTAPANCQAFAPIIEFGSDATTGRVYAGHTLATRKITHHLIVDGAIQSRHIETESIEGGHLKFDAIDGMTITGAVIRSRQGTTGPIVAEMNTAGELWTRNPAGTNRARLFHGGIDFNNGLAWDSIVRLEPETTQFSEVLSVVNSRPGHLQLGVKLGSDGGRASIWTDQPIVQVGTLREPEYYEATTLVSGVNVRVRFTGTIVQIELTSTGDPSFTANTIRNVARIDEPLWLPAGNTWGFCYGVSGSTRHGGALVRPDGTIGVVFPAATSTNIQATITYTVEEGFL